MPDSWISGECPLCGQRRRYLPADIFQERLFDELLADHGAPETGNEAGPSPAKSRNRGRFAGKLLVAAAAIAAVRLIRDDISSPTPRL